METQTSTLDVIQKILDVYDEATVSDDSHENALWAITMIKHEMKNPHVYPNLMK